MAKKYKVPAPFKKARRRFSSHIAFATALGYHPNNLSSVMAGSIPYTAPMLARVKELLAGKATAAPPGKQKGSTGLLIVIASADKFEKLYDAAKALSGQWLWKKKFGQRWAGALFLNDPASASVFSTLAAYMAEVVHL